LRVKQFKIKIGETVLLIHGSDEIIRQTYDYNYM